MAEMLTDLSAEKLALAVEENLSAWIPQFGRLGEARLDDPPGLYRAVTPITIGLFNSITDARLQPEAVENAIDYLIADARSRNIPLLWWVGPSTQPADLAVHLLQHGFVKDDDGPGMAVDLDTLNQDLPAPQGLAIVAAQDEKAWKEWCSTLVPGFEMPPARSESVTRAWVQLLQLVDPNQVIAYTARLDGKPVATSLLHLGGGVAGIYAVATIPEARRQGIGGQVTLHPLLYARQLGYRVGVLQASEMGESVYRALGFKEVCRITSYRYSP